ncbi:basic secretory protein-like protein [Aquimarina longa]|uniref:basic secretory protein-like protein n=1 Tax=Aquimarina longa TaxID=1080221 RepID=UPI0009EC891A|nr:basic secretory protein-like protein [Aquimarina longa]
MKTQNKVLLYISMMISIVLAFNVNAQSPPQNSNNLACEWGNSFLTPTVKFTDFDGSTIGSRIFNQVIPNAESYMKQRCLDVAKILYRNSANSPKFRLLNFNLKNENFVAHKFGEGDQMTIEVSTQHLAKIYRDSGNNSQVIKDEIDGILFHEVTHGYNYSPTTGGTYDGSSPFWAYTEGIADGVRIYSGFHQTKTPDVNSSSKWLGGYTTTGFFLQYVTQKYDKNFIYKFNKAAKDLGKSWSFDNAFKNILGKGVATVWNEYKNYINNGNKLDYDGNYPWTLDCGGGTTPPAGDTIDITNDGGTISSQYNDSPSNEGISNIVDNNLNSKYLTFNASAWVQYKATKSYVLSSYTITSGNDAPERDPKSWTLQGSTNGNSWQNINQRSNQDFSGRNQKRTFTVTTTSSYQYYRLSMKNNSGNILQVSEIELFGKEKNAKQLPVANFRVTKTSIKEGESVSFINSSTDATSYSWTFSGGTPFNSTQKNPTVRYNRAGTYSVTLKATNRDGSDTQTKSSYITVTRDSGGGSGDIKDITDLGGEASSQYNDSPANEGILKLFDNNANSKFLTFNASSWVQFKADKSYILSSYTLTSGNDAPERDPKSWTLQGSTNGTSWTNIDQRSNQDFSSRNQKRAFQTNTRSAYAYYRLSMRNNSGNILQISELELFGKEGSTGGGSCQWGNNFLTPTVQFTDFDGSTIGSRIFNQVIPNVRSYMQQRCLDVAKILYRNSADAPKFRLLKFELKNEDFVAYKSGEGDQMTIAVSTQHLAKIYRDSGNNSQVIKDEIDGILFHEVTHGYNYSPTTGGTYDGSSPFWAYTEGIADGVRIYSGFHQTKTPDVNSSSKWLGGYTTTGFFLQYVTEKYDKNFIYKFNKAAKDLGNSWSFDNAFRNILGKGVATVWNEYKNYINGGNKIDYDGNYPWTLDCSNKQNRAIASEDKEPVKSLSLTSYPNPAKNTLFFAKSDDLKNKILVYEIYDTHGRIVIKKQTTKDEIQINHLTNKMYFLIVRQNGKIIYKNRFIKK